MLHVFFFRLMSLIGLLGSVLLMIGFFLPVRFVTVTFLYQPPSYSVDSFGSILAHSVIGGTMLLLTILIPLLTFLVGLLDTVRRAILTLSVTFTILGFLGFLVVSRLLLSFSTWGGRVTEIHTSGPGFWLMLIGFPICIGCSVAQHLLTRLDITVVKSPESL
jgi:hypothetical protein